VRWNLNVVLIGIFLWPGTVSISSCVFLTIWTSFLEKALLVYLPISSLGH
jgi:hypothetical protein